jgi:large subunit ribosomal protein L21
MYAIVTISGKQFRVKKGDVLLVDRLVVNNKPVTNGESIDVQDVNLIAGEEGTPSVGSPTVPGAIVRVKVLGEEKGKKVIAFKKVNRNGYHKKQGHRQLYSKVQVLSIESAAS